MIDIEALQALYDAGARGTWSWEDDPATLYSGRVDPIGEFGGQPICGHGLNLLGRLEPDSNGKAVLDLIVAAVNALPALLDLARRAEAAEKRVGELEAGLEPFAKAADIRLCADDGYWTDAKTIQGTDVAFYVTFGDLRAARALITPIAEGR